MTRKTTASQAIDRHVGHRIRWHRIQKGWSQNELAEKLGVSYQQLHKYENGSNSASASRLAEIAELLDTNVASLFSGYSDADNAEPLAPRLDREQMLLLKNLNRIKDRETREALSTLLQTLSDGMK